VYVNAIIGQPIKQVLTHQSHRATLQLNLYALQGRSQDIVFVGKFRLKFEPMFFEVKKEFPPVSANFHISTFDTSYLNFIASQLYTQKWL